MEDFTTFGDVPEKEFFVHKDRLCYKLQQPSFADAVDLETGHGLYMQKGRKVQTTGSFLQAVKVLSACFREVAGGNPVRV